MAEFITAPTRETTRSDCCYPPGCTTLNHRGAAFNYHRTNKFQCCVMSFYGKWNHSTLLTPLHKVTEHVTSKTTDICTYICLCTNKITISVSTCWCRPSQLLCRAKKKGGQTWYLSFSWDEILIKSCVSYWKKKADKPGSYVRNGQTNVTLSDTQKKWWNSRFNNLCTD